MIRSGEQQLSLLTKGFLLSCCIEATSTGVVQGAAGPALFLGLLRILHMTAYGLTIPSETSTINIIIIIINRL